MIFHLIVGVPISGLGIRKIDMVLSLSLVLIESATVTDNVIKMPGFIIRIQRSEATESEKSMSVVKTKQKQNQKHGMKTRQQRRSSNNNEQRKKVL